MPISWTRHSSKKVDAQTLEAEGDATEVDKINFQSLRDAASGSSTDAVPLKVANPSPEDEAEHKRKLNTEKTAFISSAPTTLKRLIDRAVDLRLLQSKAGASEFTMAIGEKAAVVRKKTGKLVTMKEQLVTKQTSCNETFIGDLTTSVALNEQETKDLLECGDKLGCRASKKRARNV